MQTCSASSKKVIRLRLCSLKQAIWGLPRITTALQRHWNLIEKRIKIPNVYL